MDRIASYSPDFNLRKKEKQRDCYTSPRKKRHQSELNNYLPGNSKHETEFSLKNLLSEHNQLKCKETK